MPEYLQQSTPIPVILTATNPSLLPPKLTEEDYPVLRMLPTDDQQVEEVADFPKVKAATDSPKRDGGEPVFWVAEDTFSANPTYSHFLATRFVEQAERSPFRVHLWSSSYSLLPFNALPDLGVNWVFFTGDWSHALILIRQLNAISKRAQRDDKSYRAPHVMLNETSMDQRLIDEGGKDVEGIYLTYPLPKWNPLDKGMGNLGHETYQVVEQLLNATDSSSQDLAVKRGGILYKLKRLLGIRRVTDARNALITKMELRDTTYDLGGTKCEFERDGTKWVDEGNHKSAPTFHVFQVLNGNFQPFDQIAINKRPRDHAHSAHASVRPSPGIRLMQRAELSQRTF